MIENRQSFRLRKLFYIKWSIPEQKIEGEAVVSNISLTGVSLVTDKLFKPEHGMIINFKCAESNAFPAKGKLVWFNKAGEEKSRYRCGLRFMSDAIANQSWIKWMEDNMASLGEGQDTKIITNILREGRQE